jgi:hypothetical protein
MTGESNGGSNEKLPDAEHYVSSAKGRQTRKGLNRESEGQKSGKDRAFELLASRSRRFFFSILSLSLDAFLL